MSDIALRPRTGPELIDAAIQLYRRHFVPLVTVSALLNIPLFALQFGFLALPEQIVEHNVSAAMAVLGTASVLGYAVFSSILECAVVTAASDRYLGVPIDPMGTIARVLRRLGPVLLASILKVFLVFGALGGTMLVIGLAAVVSNMPALILLAVPVILIGAVPLYANLFAVPFIVMLEPVGATEAIGRSVALARGRVGKIVGTLAIAWLFFGVALMAVALFGALASGVSHIVASVIVQLGTCVAYPLIAIVGMLLYYDARVVKEGLDVELMSRELDAEVGVVPAQ